MYNLLRKGMGILPTEPISEPEVEIPEDEVIDETEEIENLDEVQEEIENIDEENTEDR